MDDPAAQRELRREWAGAVKRALLAAGVERAEVADLATSTLARLHAPMVAGLLTEVYEAAKGLADERPYTTKVHERLVWEVWRDMRKEVSV